MMPRAKSGSSVVAIESGGSCVNQPSLTASMDRRSKRPVGFESAPRPVSPAFTLPFRFTAILYIHTVLYATSAKPSRVRRSWPGTHRYPAKAERLRPDRIGARLRPTGVGSTAPLRPITTATTPGSASERIGHGPIGRRCTRVTRADPYVADAAHSGATTGRLGGMDQTGADVRLRKADQPPAGKDSARSIHEQANSRLAHLQHGGSTL